MKKLLLLIAVACALVAFAPAASADPYYCDGVQPDNVLVEFVSIDNAQACGGAAGLAWRVAGPYGVWWAGWCSNLGASAWVGNEYWHCTWFYG